MALRDNVKRVGRVEFIEPNSLFVNSDGDKVQNGIPQPYEDYSISVHLRVINGNRYDCGLPSDGNDIVNNVLDFSSDNGTISFMDGTEVNGNQGYLTTNFTDISMNDPNTNTKECLGIESITIRYNSWYAPTVDIKFIDVRGASLMQPAEYEYYNNGNPGKKERGPESNSDFFKAFFSFPYPLFKLSVKGFYGKEVTYDLSVVKCNIEFNSSTGNFEVSASFIGYMYGMYADLPFPFVYIAPYIDLYGKNTWEEKTKRTGDFCYLTTDKENPIGREMYTFPELRAAVQNASKEADKRNKGSISGLTSSELEQLSEQLSKEVIPNFPMSSKNFSWWSWTSTGKKGYHFFVSDETEKEQRGIFKDILTFSDASEKYNQMILESDYCKDVAFINEKIFSSINTDAKEVLAKKTGNSASSNVVGKYTGDDIKKILKNHIAYLSFHSDLKDEKNPLLVFDETKSTFGSSTRSTYDSLITELKRRFEKSEANAPMLPSQSKKSWVVMAIETEDVYYKRDVLTDELNKINKRNDEYKIALDKERTISIEEGVKFKPTLKNMYNMVFAHIDTFMSVFYNTLDRIRKSIQSSTDDTRKSENFLGGSVYSDVNKNSLSTKASNGGKLPPFTMFYKEETEKDSNAKKVTMIWPGSLPGGENLDEVKLVEAIINATSLDKKRIESVSPKDNVVRPKGDLAPINYYDLIRESGNPYLDVLKNRNQGENSKDFNIVKEVIKVFILRCYYALLSGSYISEGGQSERDGMSSATENFTKKAKLIAELEVKNVERAFTLMNASPDNFFKTTLLGLPKDSSSVISEYIGGENPVFSQNGANGNLEYRWIVKSTNEGDELYAALPVGTFVNRTLKNYVLGGDLKGDADKFLKISKDSNAFKNNTFSCHLYSGGKYMYKKLSKYSTGDFVNAGRLFKNHNSLPSEISGIKFTTGTFSGSGDVTINDIYSKIGSSSFFAKTLSLPSYRTTSAGVTNIFMDPLFYAQNTAEARAYIFLMGIPFANDKTSFFLPEIVENGDYPTLMLLREGAVYWRNDFFWTEIVDDYPKVIFSNDPITYEYPENGNGNFMVDVLRDVEANDPRFGRVVAAEHYTNPPKNLTEARRQLLIDYFVKWATGIEPKQRPDAVTASTYVKIEVPDTRMNFPTIERNLSLLYQNGNQRDILNPANAFSAVTVEYIDGFANPYQLRNIYNVGSDRKLGKLSKNKIRTDVILNDGSKAIDSVREFLGNFVNFYVGFDTVIDYACQDVVSETYTVPRNAMNNAVSAFVEGLKEMNGISVDKLKNSSGTDSSGIPDDSEKPYEQFKDTDLKLACYMALKNMYDRWLCSRRRESWFFSCIPERMVSNSGIRSDFTRFFYIDEFYHDTGMKIKPNLTDVSEMYAKIGGFTEKTNEENLASESILKVLSITAEKAGCALLTLPTMLGLARTGADESNSIADVFKAFPYNEAVRSNDIETSFITLYSNQKSSILDIGDDAGKVAYNDDGFDLANTWGEIVPQTMFSDNDEDSFVVPCFGVTFAKQNQSFFKDVRLSMEDHQVTEYSLKNTLMISYMNNRGPRETNIVGQDLYSVFANYSYTCSVSMMGDAQITPLMYFQLNNISMWKGAYLITSVQHQISANGMETTFTGTRQARPAVPLKSDDIIAKADPSSKQTPQSKDETKPQSDNASPAPFMFRPLDSVNVDDVKSIIFRLTRTSLRESQKWVNGILTAYIYYNNGETETQNVSLTIEPNNGLGKRIENFRPEDATVYFILPCGRYPQLVLENVSKNDEYRDPNDSFYNYMDGKHIMVVDYRLANSDKSNEKQNGGINTKFDLPGSTSRSRCEIITGVTNMDIFETGGIEDISVGAASPIMLYPNEDAVFNNSDNDADEIRAVYREIFDLIRRMNEAKKPISLYIVESDDVLNSSNK